MARKNSGRFAARKARSGSGRSRKSAPRRRASKSTKLGSMAAGIYVAARAVQAGRSGGVKAGAMQAVEDVTGYTGNGFNVRAPLTTAAVGIGGKVASKVASKAGINRFLGGITKRLTGRKVVV